VGPSALAGGPPEASVVAEMRHEIRILVQEIAQVAQTNVQPDEFYAAFLPRVVSAMGAVGGVVWVIGESGRLRSAFQVNLAQTGLDAAEHRPQHGGLLKKAIGGNQAIIVPPKSGAGGADEAGNPSELLLVLAPLVVENQPQGIVEVFQRPGGGPTTQRGYLRFLIQMCDLACDYLKNRRLRQLEENQSLWQQLEQFVQAIHASLDVRTTSFALVNEGRRLAGCDRVSLALAYGGQCRIEAVSGLDTIDRRAAEVKRLARLATSVLRTGEPLWHQGEETELPPQIDGPLQEYVDRSHARMVAVLPLVPAISADSDGKRTNARPLGAIILEQLRDARATESLRTRSQLVAQHGAQALSRAIDHSSLFLLPVWQALGKSMWMFRGRSLPRTLLVAGALAGAVFALATVQTDFEVAARGKLQPAIRREIFAQVDGIVAKVPVRHGQSVAPGAVLAELSNTNQELELAALIGRQTTNQEQIAAHQRALLDNSSAAGVRLSPAEESRLSGELMQLRQEAQNVERELTLFHEKQKQLVVTAAEAGQVVTWKVEDALQGRPVIRGQALMTLANPDGPWEIELYVPERRLAHIQAAQAVLAQNGGEDSRSAERPPLDVVFTLSSHPGAQFSGQVVEIEQTAEVRGDEGNTVLVRVAIDKEKLPPLHDQTTVTAKLYCGRTSVGYAWFCDLIETVQSKVLFWLPS
ncbi:MAG: HlyD family efflux transporter periplasmic adaptor subunit, partial [Planctomycetaceae bacterium]|nr:HlyD family efflux transporter periplasmic adaptor subunit [Planctomycetaceae bacterium]